MSDLPDTPMAILKRFEKKYGGAECLGSEARRIQDLRRIHTKLRHMSEGYVAALENRFALLDNLKNKSRALLKAIDEGGSWEAERAALEEATKEVGEWLVKQLFPASAEPQSP